MTAQQLLAHEKPRRPPERLYHLAEASNLASILEHGLLSTQALLALARFEDTSLLRAHRPDNLALSDSIVIRDQRPMPPSALARALTGGLEPADWYALLNAHVFLWPDLDRMERQLGACRGRPQAILTFDAEALFAKFGAEALFSPINSGNARRAAAMRGLDTLVPYATWLKEGWPTGLASRPPAEVLFRCRIPAEAPYLLDVRKA